MTPFLQLAIALAIIIAAAKLGGYLSYKLGQPSVLGELLVGLLLGPSVIDLLHLPYFTSEHLGETIHELAEIGVLLLMFIAGLELHIADLIRSGKISAYAGTLGVLFPLLGGLGVGLMYGQELNSSVFLGLILAATSVSISAQTLMELGVLRSRVGIALLGAAVFDDILVVLGISLSITAVISTNGAELLTVLSIALRMVLFLGLASALGFWILPRLSRRVESLPISQGLVSFTIVVLLLYGWSAEVVGNMAAITGAFLAGLFLARSPAREHIESGMSALAYGMFVPIFFINVGLSANARELTGDALILLVILSIVAILTKILGAGLGARIAGFTNRESLQLGVGMMSRGEVGLIAASVGIAEGVISQTIFSTIVGVVIITTLLTPPMLRFLFRAKETAPVVPASGE